MPAPPSPPPQEAPAPPGPRPFRALFLSDLHLGNPWCQARELARFLSFFSCDSLYLVGDIVDGWKVRQRSRWPQSHRRVIQKLLQISQHTRICYITGNHDDFLDAFDGRRFGHIEICRRALHHTADGRRFSVLHGDEFDRVVKRHRWIARLGDRAYGVALGVNAGLGALRSWMGWEPWSLSDYLKHKVKDVVGFLSDFEAAVLRETARERSAGVICGHLHRPALKNMRSIVYANCGDWVESCSALAERPDGRLEILRWRDWSAALAPERPSEGEILPEEDPAVATFPLPPAVGGLGLS